jgi:hypothetical protein
VFDTLIRDMVKDDPEKETEVMELNLRIENGYLAIAP